MIYRIAADGVLLIHLGFILVVIAGAGAVFRYPWFAWIHLPAAAWGIFVELSGRICPLTVLENALRRMAGQQGYSDSFLEHYLVPLIYPAGLTRGVQFALAGLVISVNVVLYLLVLRSRRRAKYGVTTDDTLRRGK